MYRFLQFFVFMIILYQTTYHYCFNYGSSCRMSFFFTIFPMFRGHGPILDSVWTSYPCPLGKL